MTKTDLSDYSINVGMLCYTENIEAALQNLRQELSLRETAQELPPMLQAKLLMMTELERVTSHLLTLANEGFLLMEEMSSAGDDIDDQLIPFLRTPTEPLNPGGDEGAAAIDLDEASRGSRYSHCLTEALPR